MFAQATGLVLLFPGFARCPLLSVLFGGGFGLRFGSRHLYIKTLFVKIPFSLIRESFGLVRLSVLSRRLLIGIECQQVLGCGDLVQFGLRFLAKEANELREGYRFF